MGELTGKLAFVTGSTGAIGQRVVSDLRQKGAKVVTHGFRPRQWTDYLDGDLTSESVVGQLFSLLWDRHGEPDVLVCCAGGNRRLNGFGPPERDDCLNLPMDEFWHQFHLNFTSAVYCCRLAAPAMVRKKWGRIVTLSSCLVRHPRPKSVTATYACAKAAVEEYTIQLASQLRPHNVTVNCVSPSSTKDGNDFDTMIRYAHPEEIASVVGFACGQSASYLSGQIIRVNGANVREQSWMGRE